MTPSDSEEFRDELRDLVEDMIRILQDVDNLDAVHERMNEGEFEEAFEMMGLTPKQADSIARS